MLFSSKKSIGTLSVPVVLGIAGIHVLALLAVLPWYFSWSGFAWFLFLYWVTGGLGVTLCYHRLLTHRSFETYRWIRYLLTIFGTLAFQGSVLTWVGTHRIHHQHSDEEGDPHSPLHGKWWAHYLWFMFNPPPEENPLAVVKDLLRDPGIVLIDKYFWMPQLVLTIALFGLGFWVGGLNMALSWIIWGVGVRTTFVYHVTWLVNSGCHLWGYKNFKTTDQSRNNWLIAILSFGEGWHENHHAEPTVAAHGNRHWYEFDLTYWTILGLQALGLARKVVVPKRPLGT